MQSRWPSGLKISVRKKTRFCLLDSMTDSFDSGSTTFRTAKRASKKIHWAFTTRLRRAGKQIVLKLGILLHVNWLAVVYAAAQGYPLLALFSVLSAGLCLRMHPATSVRLGLVATLIGMAGDMTVVAMGGLDFSTSSPVLPVPMWMGGLWLVFGTSLPAFEPFLSKRFWLTRCWALWVV